VVGVLDSFPFLLQVGNDDYRRLTIGGLPVNVDYLVGRLHDGIALAAAIRDGSLSANFCDPLFTCLSILEDAEERDELARQVTE
jgi:hypothetical protein